MGVEGFIASDGLAAAVLEVAADDCGGEGAGFDQKERKERLFMAVVLRALGYRSCSRHCVPWVVRREVIVW